MISLEKSNDFLNVSETNTKHINENKNNKVDRVKKSNLCHTRGITPKRVL